MKLYQAIARTLNARQNCIKFANTDWIENHEYQLEEYAKLLPHGSGIDGDVKIDWDTDGEKSFTIHGEYHAMNDAGYYDGWYDFSVKVRASLMFGADILVTGRFGKYADVKDYLQQTFDMVLNSHMCPECGGLLDDYFLYVQDVKLSQGRQCCLHCQTVFITPQRDGDDPVESIAFRKMLEEKYNKRQ